MAPDVRQGLLFYATSLTHPRAPAALKFVTAPDRARLLPPPPEYARRSCSSWRASGWRPAGSSRPRPTSFAAIRCLRAKKVPLLRCPSWPPIRERLSIVPSGRFSEEWAIRYSQIRIVNLLRQLVAFSKNEAVFLRAEVRGGIVLSGKRAGRNMLDVNDKFQALSTTAMPRPARSSKSSRFRVFQTHRQFADAPAGGVKYRVADRGVGSDIGQFANPLLAVIVLTRTSRRCSGLSGVSGACRVSPETW
jgi:hypothetical protein